MTNKHVSIEVTHGKAYAILDRVIINGSVDHEIVCTATKTGDSWEFSVQCTTHDIQFMKAVSEAILLVQHGAEKIGFAAA